MQFEKINELKRIIESSDNIVFFGGAGVSTESGIPDFRSESGLYQALNDYGRPAEELICRPFFDRKPEIFFDYYKKNLIYPEAKPNEAHYALARLERQGKVKAIVTQNIDGLHQQAGSKNVLELHGSVLRNNCMQCGTVYDLHYILDPRNCLDGDGHETMIPMCSKCGGIVKPDVVLYQESLNEQTLSNAVAAIENADTLIVGGTSLVVYPAAGLINYFKGKHLILINKSTTQYDGRADLVINDAIGSIFAALLDF